jgi:short-subunit dehydrogenase
VAPCMQRRGSGAIVHIASRPGIEPSAGTAAYSVSKAALVFLVSEAAAPISGAILPAYGA